MKIPVLSTSAASRIIVITSFSLSVLGAFGFDQLKSDWIRRIWKKRTAWLIGIGIVICILWGIVYIVKPLPSEWLTVAKRNLILPTIILVSVCAVMAMGFVKKRFMTLIAAAAIVILSCFDSYRYASKWMPFDPKEFIYPQVKVITALQKEVGFYRVFGNIGNEVGSYFGIPLIEGYDAMYQGRYGEFLNAISNGIISTPGRSVVQLDKHGLYTLPAFQLLGVKYILHRISDGRNIWAFPYWQYGSDVFKSIYRDEHYELFEYRDVFPRTFLASSYVVHSDMQTVIDTLFQKGFNRRETLVLEEKPPIEPLEGEGRAEISFYSPTKIIINVQTTVPKLLFFSDTFDAGWNALVDGKKEKIFRADYDFRAVAVSEGTHVVEFRYHPVLFRIGVLLSFVSTIMLIAFSLYFRKK